MKKLGLVLLAVLATLALSMGRELAAAPCLTAQQSRCRAGLGGVGSVLLSLLGGVEAMREKFLSNDPNGERRPATQQRYQGVGVMKHEKSGSQAWFLPAP